MSLGGSEIVRLDLPSNYKHLSILGACIAELLARVEGIADRDRQTFNIQLAAHEACTNIIDHAYADNPAGRIMITLTIEPQPRRLIVELHDTGRSFDLTGVPAPDLSQAREHGYGLFLVRSLMDEVLYTSGEGGNHWCLIKSI